MLAGLIGAAAGGLKGAADAYSMGAKSEYDKQQKIDLSQELLNMEEEKALRVDKVLRSRNLEDVGNIIEPIQSVLHLSVVIYVGESSLA